MFAIRLNFILALSTLLQNADFAKIRYVDVGLIAIEWSRNPNEYKDGFRKTQFEMVDFMNKNFDRGDNSGKTSRISIFCSDATLTQKDAFWRSTGFTENENNYGKLCSIDRSDRRGVGKILTSIASLTGNKDHQVRPGVTQVTIVLTDGYLDDENTQFPSNANRMKQDPNKFFVLYSEGGLSDKSKLERLAGKPDHVIFYDKNDWPGTLRRLFNALCAGQGFGYECKVESGKCQRKIVPKHGDRPECVDGLDHCKPDDCKTTVDSSAPTPVPTLPFESTSSSVSSYESTTALFESTNLSFGSTSAFKAGVHRQYAAEETSSPGDIVWIVGVFIGGLLLLILITLFVICAVVSKRKKSTVMILKEKGSGTSRSRTSSIDPSVTANATGRGTKGGHRTQSGRKESKKKKAPVATGRNKRKS